MPREWTGQPDEAAGILAKLRARQDKGLPSSWFIALVHLGLGENDKALGALEDAVEQHEGILIYSNALHLFDPIRPEPRFQNVLRKMNLHT